MDSQGKSKVIVYKVCVCVCVFMCVCVWGARPGCKEKGERDRDSGKGEKRQEHPKSTQGGLDVVLFTSVVQSRSEAYLHLPDKENKRSRCEGLL